MSFKDLAAPYIAMGISVFPLQPKSKVPPDWMLKFPVLASVDPKQIDEWDSKLPDANLALLSKADSVGDPCFLEFDVPKGMTDACAEMGQEFPHTRIHISGRKFSHIVFTHTERSLAIGNRNAKLAGGKEWFSFRAKNRYVLGPGSVHPETGNVYGVKADVMPIAIPDWVCDWIERHSVSERKTMGNLPPVSEEFDFDDFAESLPFSLLQDGDYYIASFCPGVGRKHKNSLKTGIYFDGGVLGWNCFAQKCPCAYDENGSHVSIGGMLKFLREEFDWEYDGVIWDKQTTQEMMEDFGAEMVDLAEAEKAIFDDPVQPISNPIPTHSETGPTHPCTRCGGGIDDKRMTSVCDACVEKAQPLPKTEEKQPEPEAEKPADTKEFVLQAGKTNDDVYSLIGILASDIEPEKLEWLWRDKIPAGKITLFAGQPDCGKSLALLDVIAHITTGKDFPDGAVNEHPEGRKVLLAATEDDLASTLVPRLIAAGADMTRVVILKRVIVENGAKQKTKKRMLQLGEDSKLLKLTLRKNPDIAVVALDPISSYFGDCDPNKDKEIRPVMEAIQAACDESKTAFIGIIHNNKRGDADAIGKILGASSIVGVSRAVWGFCKDKEKKGEFYMSLVKGNLSRKRSGMKYMIEDAFVEIDGEKEILPKTAWIGESEESADEVMQKNRDAEGAGKDDKKSGKATALIQGELEKAPRLAREMYELGEKEGIGEKTMKRAVKELGIFVKKQPSGPWWWSLNEAEPWNIEERIMTVVGDGL
jgi:putative DNA primase/helicase